MSHPSPQGKTVRAKRTARLIAGASAFLLITPFLGAATVQAAQPVTETPVQIAAYSTLTSAPKNSVGILTESEASGPDVDGLDNAGRGLSRQELNERGITPGAPVPYGETGVVFTWPNTAPGEPDHWRPEGQVIEFDGIQASGISFLGTASNGAASGTVEVTYVDGSSFDLPITFSDWVPGQVVPGNSRVINLQRRVESNGNVVSGGPVIFATTVAALDQNKAVQSVTLPAQVTGGNMHIFDVALRPIQDEKEYTLPSRPAVGEPTAPELIDSDEFDGTVLLDEATTWRYLDTGVDPAPDPANRTSWTVPGFDDSAWSTGITSFGAKSGQIGDLGGGFMPHNLLQQYKPGTTTNIEAFFFRAEFDLSSEHLASVERLTGQIAYDDAARVFINGEQVQGFSDSRLDEAPESAGNMVYAGGNGTNPIVATLNVPAEVLVEGTNTIAIQVHNTNAGSSDVYFELTELTFVSAQGEVNYSDVVLLPGTDETTRNLTFYSDRDVAGLIQIAPVSARTGDDFPVGSAETLSAVREEAPDGRFAHKVTFEDLEEDTAYIYRVGGENAGWSRSYELWTGTYGDAFSFILLGDTQLGASGNLGYDRQRWINSAAVLDRDQRDASFILSAGDQVESHHSEAEYEALLAPEIVKQLPFAPTIGNHDNQSNRYNAHFNIANLSEEHGYEPGQPTRAGGNNFYHFNDVLFIHLNSNARSVGEQDHIEYLEKVIAAEGDNANWTVVVWHHSIYSAAFHSVDQDVIERRAALAPVMSELGVDAVLAGHDHIYTRSYLMNGTTPSGDLEAQEQSGITLYPTEEEVLYVTANSSTGSKFYGIDDRSPDAAIKDQSNEPQYTDVDVTPESLTFTTYHTHDGRVVDKVTIARDVTAPVFVGIDDVDVAQGGVFDPRSGVVATDDLSGDLTEAFVVIGDVDTSQPGTYILTYRVSDGAGNETELTRTVTVTAVQPTFAGVPDRIEVEEGQEFDPLQGVTATDANGDDLTEDIQVEVLLASSTQAQAAALAVDGPSVSVLAAIDAPTAGEYVIVYSVTDRFGTTGTANAPLTVTEAGTVPPVDGSDDDDAGSGGLPITGAQSGLILTLAVLALFGGLVMLRRQRSITA